MKNKHMVIILLLIIFLATAVWAADDNGAGRAAHRRVAAAPGSWPCCRRARSWTRLGAWKSTSPPWSASNLDRDVFIIGEYHDSYACHAWQKEFIEALARAAPAPGGGLRVLQPRRRPGPGPLPGGKISEAELLQKTGWYKRSALNFAYTRLVLETVKRLGLKAVGLNVPRELVSRVAKGGFAKLSAAERGHVPRRRAHRSRARIFRPQHAGRIRRAGAALVPERLRRPEMLGHGHGRIHAPGPGAPGIPGLQGRDHRRQRPRGLWPGHPLALSPAATGGRRS